MYYDEEFIQSLPEDSDSALLRIASVFNAHWEAENDLNEPPSFSLVRDTHALISVYLQKEGLSQAYTDPNGGPTFFPEFTGDEAADTRAFTAFLAAMCNEVTTRVSRNEYAESRQRYSLLLGAGGFHYEFSKGDIARIQKLVNELRDLIAASEELEARHKRRVLSRLERLQSELHKRVSDLSWMWGELIEASIAAKIIGENAKPIVKRIHEIADIVWPVQARSFELPSNTPFRLPGQAEDANS